MAQNGNRKIPGNAADPKRPVAKIAGLDYCAIEGSDPALRDDFVKSGVTKKNAPRGPYAGR